MLAALIYNYNYKYGTSQQHRGLLNITMYSNNLIANILIRLI